MTKFDQIVSVVKRQNNKNRNFLFLNKFQAKYLPTVPQKAIDLFEKIADQIPKSDKKTVVIGFAETATAIGAIVAKKLGNDIFYIHSTRESLGNLPKVYFKEEHSHAKNHELCLFNLDILKSAERVIFVDDEFTTGKTVCNFILALKDNQVISENTELIVATLINCMENQQNFEKLGVKYYYIIAENRDFSKTVWSGQEVSDIIIEKSDAKYNIFEYKDYIDIRKGANIGQYDKVVDGLCEFILKSSEIKKNYENVLVLGTEECMYPAILAAKYLEEKLGLNAVSYATSRSPIAVLDSEDYPLKNRAKIHSFYDYDRKVHLYNVKKYDKVIVITDSKNGNFDEIASLLKMYENNDIDVVIWG